MILRNVWIHISRPCFGTVQVPKHGQSQTCPGQMHILGCDEHNYTEIKDKLAY